jgi:DNA polymerase-4/DNA polymerase V
VFDVTVLQDFPFSTCTKYILHLDADAFFASCEQAIHPEYRGKPVVTGKERGIVSAASYEAKKFGIKRGVPLWDVKKLCPEAIIVPSDYETYGLYSKRMFAIMRRFLPIVEEYSIDEAFADCTGMPKVLGMSYAQIAKTIKEAIEKELGITVSVGLSMSKVLAKIASSFDKPSGCIVIPPVDIHRYLEELPSQSVWGIGKKTSLFLRHYKIKTAGDFVNKNWHWVRQYMSKPYQEIWRELRGENVFAVNPKPKELYKSVSKIRTFTPASSDQYFVFSQLCKNLQNAFIKVRRHKLLAKRLVVILKKQDYSYSALEAKLNRETAYPHEVMDIVKELFQQIYQKNTLYRATSVVLSDLQESSAIQMSLFEGPRVIEKSKKLYQSIDSLAKRYGKHTVFFGASYQAETTITHKNGRADISDRKKQKLGRMNGRKFVNLPFLVSAP